MSEFVEKLRGMGFDVKVEYQSGKIAQHRWKVLAERRQSGVEMCTMIASGVDLDSAVLKVARLAKNALEDIRIAIGELVVEPNTDAKTALEQPVVIREANDRANEKAREIEREMRKHDSEEAEPVKSVFESNHAEVCDFDDVYNETKNMGGRVIRQNAILFDIENKSKAYAKRLVVPIGCVASEEAEPISIKPGFQKRMQSYQYAIQTGVLSPNEVRMLEGLPVFGGAKQ